MDYAFDKQTGRLIVYIDESDGIRQRTAKLREAFKSDRWKPGNDIMAFVSDFYSPPALPEIEDLIKVYKKHKVRKVAIMTTDVLAEATADTARRIAELYHIPLKHFDNLQEMFDWINE